MSTTEKPHPPIPAVAKTPATPAAAATANAAGSADTSATSGAAAVATGLAGTAAAPGTATLPGVAGTSKSAEAVREQLTSAANPGSRAPVEPPPTPEELLQEILRQVKTTNKLATEQAEPPPPRPPAAIGTVAPPPVPKVPTPGSNKNPPPPPSPPRPPGGGDEEGGDDKPPATLREKVDEIDVTTRGLANKLQEGYALSETISGDVAAVTVQLGVIRATSEGLTGTLGQVSRDITEVKGVAKGAQIDLAAYRMELAPVLDAAKGDRTELRSTIKQVQDSISTALHNATETRKEVQALQKALDDADKSALRYRDELKAELSETQKRLAELYCEVDERLGPDIKTLTADLKEHADRTAPVLAEVKTGVTAVAASLTNSVLPKVEKTGEAVAQLAENARQLDRDLKTAQSQLQQALSRDLAERLTKVASAEALGALGKETTNELRAVHSKQEQAAVSLKGLTDALPVDLKPRLEALTSKLAQLASEVAGGTALGEVAERVEQIEKSVGLELGLKLREVESDLKAAHGTLDKVATADALKGLQHELKAAEERLKTALTLTETKLGAKIDTALGVAQQAADGAAAGVQGVGELKEPVGAVKRSVGDALELRLGIVHRDLGELGAEVKRKLDALTGEVTATHAALAGTVIPSLKEAKAATQSVGAQLDKRSEEVRAAVAEAAKTTSKVVKERVEAVSQAVSQLGSQRTQDHAALLQQVHQLRSDVTAPLGKIATAVGDGLAQRIDSQATTLGELARVTTERLGGVSTTLTTVKQNTDSLGSDLAGTRSTLERLATAVPLHQGALMGELATLRTLTQDGLVTAVRSSSNDLKDHLLSLDAKVETRVEVLKTQLSQLADRGGQQHAQVVADVSAIRDLVRADGSTQSRLAEAVQRKLDDTHQQMTVLTADTKHYQSALLNDIGGVHSAVGNHLAQSKAMVAALEKSVQAMVDTLRTQLPVEFSERLRSTIATLNQQTEDIHRYTLGAQKSIESKQSAEEFKRLLQPEFDGISKQLGPIGAIAKETKKELGEDFNDLKGILNSLTSGKIPDSWQPWLKVLAIVLIFLTGGNISTNIWGLTKEDKNLEKTSNLEEKLNRLIEAQNALKQCGEQTNKLMQVAEGTRNKLGCGSRTLDEQLAEIKALASKIPATTRQPGQSNPTPPPTASPQINNTVSICSSCGGGGSGGQGSTVNCTCLGKTTTTTPGDHSATATPKDEKDPTPAASQRKN